MFGIKIVVFVVLNTYILSGSGVNYGSGSLGEGEVLGSANDTICDDYEPGGQEYRKCESLWQYCDSGQCHCGKQVPDDIVQCDTHRNLTVLPCFCVTFNEEEGVTELGKCVYNCGNQHDVKNEANVYHSLPTNLSELWRYVCGDRFNRNGTLCGRCKDDYYPRAYSFDIDCVKCPHGDANWWKYLLMAFGPLTIFCLLVLFFKINVTSSHFLGLVIFCQTVYFPALVRVHLIISSQFSLPTQLAIRVVCALYGFWNLDFFRSLQIGICLKIDTLQMLALNVILSVYPHIIIILSYVLILFHDRGCMPLAILWRPFGKLLRRFRNNWNIRTYLIDAFATFLVLSNLKLLSEAFNLLIPVRVYQLMPSGNYTYTWRLFYDATIPTLE